MEFSPSQHSKHSMTPVARSSDSQNFRWFDDILRNQNIDPAALRPIFIYYQRRKPGERRPFHHVFLILIRDHRSEELEDDTVVVCFDRYGGSQGAFSSSTAQSSGMLCRMKKNKEIEYHKIKSEGWVKCQGCTLLSPDEIHEKGTLIESHYDNPEIELARSIGKHLVD